MNSYTKQDVDVIDIDVDYSQYFPAGDIIASAVATADVGVTLESTVINTSASIVKQWIAGGTDGSTYEVHVVATTAAGRVKKWDFKVKVKNV